MTAATPSRSPATKVFRRILLTALIAGAVAGLFTTAMQAWQVLPILHAAERLEEGEPHEHHGAGPWEPAPGLERAGFTLLANLLTGIGFAMMLSGAMAVRGRDTSAREGVLWGAAGFAAFTLAPSLGLPPELPGTMAADIASRQAWWLATAAATAGGCALLVFGRAAWTRVAAVGLLAVPHIVGAPPPPGYAGLIPAELAAHYVAATLVTAGLFWLVLGAAAGHVYSRLKR